MNRGLNRCISASLAAVLAAMALLSPACAKKSAPATAEASKSTLAQTSKKPPTPTIDQPFISPITTNGSSFAMNGKCEDLHKLLILGAQNKEVECDAGAFAFDFASNIDGVYLFEIKQMSPEGEVSDSATVTWIRDTAIPATPVLTSPVGSPFYSGGSTLTLIGQCEESGTLVTVSGDAAAEKLCANGHFQIEITQETDASYNFKIQQTDWAGNASGFAEIQWVRDSSIPAPPILSAPSANPFYSNSEEFVVSGSCTTGHTVSLSGAENLAQECNSASFAFTVNRAVDSTYNFTLIQTSKSGASSGPVAVTWIRDSVRPSAPVLTKPASNPALSSENSILIEGTCENYATVSLTGASTASTFCAGSAFSFNISKDTDGSYDFGVTQTDQGGNVSDPTSITWIRDTTTEDYLTIALYHFDLSSGFWADSSLFSGNGHNDLTDHGTTVGLTAVFGESRGFNGSGVLLDAPDSPTLSLLRDTMTVELRTQFLSLPAKGQSMVLAGQADSNGEYSWEIRIKRNGNSYFLIFTGSLDGTAVTEITSTAVNPSTSSFHHFAVTFDKGTIRFFQDGIAKGTGTIGTAGSASLFDSSASLKIGNGIKGAPLNGIIDECRLSRTVRWLSDFTPATSPYLPD